MGFDDGVGNESLEAFRNALTSLESLQRTILLAIDAIDLEEKKKLSPRRLELISKYKKLVTQADGYLDSARGWLPPNLERLKQPFPDTLQSIISSKNPMEWPQFFILKRGPAYWLEIKNCSDVLIQALLYNPLGKWGKRYETAEETGRAGGKISTRDKPAIREFVHNLRRNATRGQMTQGQLWLATEQYTSAKPFCVADCEVYRDGAKLFHRDPEGKESPIGYDTFRKNYL